MFRAALDCHHPAQSWICLQSRHEVAEVFEVPLDFLINPTNHQCHTRFFEGREYHFWARLYGERLIWSATAAIVVNLCERLPGS